MRLPIMVDTRFLYLFSITLIITAFISYVLGWFHMQYLSLGFGLMIVSEVAVYYLDRQLKRDNLPFETIDQIFSHLCLAVLVSEKSIVSGKAC